MSENQILNVVKETFELQEKLNSVVNPNWKKAGYPFYRAAWIEGAELMDKVGYKWWKKTNWDKEQALLEAVDIYHFMLSDLILHKHGAEVVVNSFKRAETLAVPDHASILDWIESFVRNTSEYRQVRALDFAYMCKAIQVSIEDISKWYIGKNALNLFRQANGFKEGTYLKEWNGVEDNVVLADFVRSATNLTIQTVTEFLTKQYEGVKK